MQILAVDPGTKITGVAVVENGEALLYGTIRPKASDSLPVRLLHIKHELQAILAENDCRCVVVEAGFVHYRNAAEPLAKLRGILLSLADDIGVPYVEYAPKEVKQAVHSGGARKADVAVMVRGIFRLDETPEPDGERVRWSFGTPILLSSLRPKKKTS